MKPRIRTIISHLCTLACVACTIESFAAAELRVELRYPMQTDSVILTGVEDNALIFRPQGSDFGGRALLDIRTIEEQAVQLNFLLTDDFYEGLKKLQNNQPHQALPLIEPEARRFLDYMGLSHLPGNYVSTVQAYFEALNKTGNWKRLTAWIAQLPRRNVPPPIIKDIGQTALSMHAAQAYGELELMHRYLIAIEDLTPAHLEVLLSLADSWRLVGQYQKAFEIYHRVSADDSVFQVLAKLWAGYCGFYLEDSESLRLILQNLPDIQIKEPYFALRQLIDARWNLREGDFPAAMRAAARGKTHAAATDPWYPELVHTLALLYQAMNLPNAANLAHQEVSIMFPSSQWAAKSLQIIHPTNKKAP